MTINLDRVTATEHIRQIMERHDAIGEAMRASSSTAYRRRAIALRRGLRAVICSIESDLLFNESVADLLTLGVALQQDGEDDE